MLRIEEKLELKEGTTIFLPETWHDKILEFLCMSEFPYHFLFKEKVKAHELKEPLYLFASEMKKGKKQKSLLLSANVVKCLFATEVPDSNIGCSFREYVPKENTKLIITSKRNPSHVHGMFFHLSVNCVKMENEKVPYLDFLLENLIGTSFNDLSLYTKDNKYTWKFLESQDTSYMSRFEMTIQDAFIHKAYVMRECQKLAEYLNSKGAKEHARLILERGKSHDNSKITCEEEFTALSKIIHLKGKMSSLESLSPYESEFVKLHQKHNSHHIEYHKSVYDVPRIDLMEFSCDICARSKQKGTNPIDYLTRAQEERFHFPQYMLDEIMLYCNYLRDH